MPENPKTTACPQCRCIFQSEGEELCHRCQQEQQRKNLRKTIMQKLHQPPENPVIECLIQREGNTQVFFGATVYTFRRNGAGDCVCTVTNPAHHRRLLKQPGQYRLYEPAA